MSSSASVEGARRALSQFAAGVQLLKILDKRPAHESDVVENLVCTAARLAEEAVLSGAAGGRCWLARSCDAHDKCRVVGQARHMRDCCALACYAVVCEMHAGQLRAPQCTPKLAHCCKPRQHAIRSATTTLKPHLPHGHSHSLHLPAMPPAPPCHWPDRPKYRCTAIGLPAVQQRLNCVSLQLCASCAWIHIHIWSLSCIWPPRCMLGYMG